MEFDAARMVTCYISIESARGKECTGAIGDVVSQVAGSLDRLKSDKFKKKCLFFTQEKVGLW